MSLEQDYYDFLTRTDHPVFKRDYSTEQSADSGFNAILNRVVARQLVKMREALNVLKSDTFPNTVTPYGIAFWESRYFGFVKPLGIEHTVRRDQLVFRINNRVGLTIQDVINIAFSITGVKPKEIRNAYFTPGWILGESALGIDTILNADDSVDARQTYLVIFGEVIPTELLAQFDKELTKIEKAGSQHFISAPTPIWILDQSTLGKDTILI